MEEEPPIDFRKVLLEYLKVVIWEEGTTFVTGAARHEHAKRFSEEEWRELRELAEEAHREALREPAEGRG